MLEIPQGSKAELLVQVGPEMAVDFDELSAPHPVYASYWLSRHAEQVSLRLLLPYLEPGESSMGVGIQIEHRASALVGMWVRLQATLEQVLRNRVYASVSATSDLGDRIADAHTVQAVLPQASVDRRLAELRERYAAQPWVRR
jgi:predicted thioesterase